MYLKILKSPEKIAQFVSAKIKSKSTWWKENACKYKGRKWRSWQDKVIEILYRENLEINVKKHGRIRCKTGDVLVIDWLTCCPILEKCKMTGARTITVCSVLYHAQYQALLSMIDPTLIFTRDYARIRSAIRRGKQRGPKYCREIIHKLRT